MPHVLFTDAAQADFAEAVTWYDTHAPDVTARFQSALDEIVQRIETSPRQFSPASHGTRRATLRHFPYLVIFRERADACYVVAVFHTSRNPRIWQGRTS